ncbi:MAG: hypothetical protein RLZZ580_1816, partial [Cyanobacteriota bacterium]
KQCLDYQTQNEVFYQGISGSGAIQTLIGLFKTKECYFY